MHSSNPAGWRWFGRKTRREEGGVAKVRSSSFSSIAFLIQNVAWCDEHKHDVFGRIKKGSKSLSFYPWNWLMRDEADLSLQPEGQ